MYETGEKFQCEIKLILHVERAHKHFYTLEKKKEVYVTQQKKMGKKRYKGGYGENLWRTLEHISQITNKVLFKVMCPYVDLLNHSNKGTW